MSVLNLSKKDSDKNTLNLRRPDIEHILLERTKENSVNIKYNTQIVEINQTPSSASVKLQNGDINSYDLVVGADGVHSGVRKMVFGEEQQFSRYLGYGIAAFQTTYREEIDDSIKIFQEPNRSAIYYPVSANAMDCVFLFLFNSTERVRKENYNNILIDTYIGSKWINQDVIRGIPNESRGFFDVLKQIEMEKWTKNRV